MQRSYLLCWLAVAVGLVGTQCVDSISDDCTKTLTCDDQQPILGNDCVWYYPNSDRVWEGGPKLDETTGRWRWPDGKETATQEFDCTPGGDAGADAGSGVDCRRGTPCDLPQVCDVVTGDCVECLDDTECSGNMATGDAGAATTCDEARHECVRCLDDADCMGGVCKVDMSSSSGNVCVECLVNENCGGDRPICDTATNECTASCTSDAECRGDKPVCNTSRNLCVECLDSSRCTDSTATQCNLSSNECVECLDDAPCAATNRICDLAQNTCVECQADAQCAARPDAATLPYCEVEDKTCVGCLNDTQCTDSDTSRCNPVLHTCVGCTSDSQCENGQLCNAFGACVDCLDNAHCTTSPVGPLCDTATGRCAECLNPDSSECRTDDAARCETSVTSPEFHTCVTCNEHAQCANKPFDGPLCHPLTGNCVSCISNAECLSVGTSRCGNGTCGVCSINQDCALFNGEAGRPLAPACLNGVGCVECTLNGDCSGAEPRCKVNNLGEALGPAPVNTCVECIANADCPGAGESLCQNNTCVPCVADADCDHVDSNGSTAGGTPLNVCDAGTCVQCTGPKRGACGTNVCNSVTKACTAFPVGSAELCATCVSDAHCAASERCATHLFGTTVLGPFCFPVSTGGDTCSLTPYSGLTAATTVDGVSASLCLLRRTTCTALQDFGTQDCDAAADCGEDGLDDGRCDENAQTCSLPCTTSVDCFDPDTNSCLGGLCQL